MKSNRVTQNNKNNNHNHMNNIITDRDKQDIISSMNTSIDSTETKAESKTFLFCFFHRTFAPLLLLSRDQFIDYLIVLNHEHKEIVHKRLDLIFTRLESCEESPVVVYRDMKLTKGIDNTLTDELILRVNGYLLVTIFYHYGRKEFPHLVTEDEPEKYRAEFERQRASLIINYGDILVSMKLIESEINYLINFVMALEWLYSHVFSIGRKINSEYLILAAMAFEGSNRLFSRGGGSGPARKIREEIYRRVTGKKKQVRQKKTSKSGSYGAEDKAEESMEVVEEQLPTNLVKRKREGDAGDKMNEESSVNSDGSEHSDRSNSSVSGRSSASSSSPKKWKGDLIDARRRQEELEQVNTADDDELQRKRLKVAVN